MNDGRKCVTAVECMWNRVQEGWKGVGEGRCGLGYVRVKVFLGGAICGQG